jgi:hypothetical protein
MSRPQVVSDDDLAAVDLGALLRSGLTGEGAQARGRLFAEGAVGAAIRADRAGVQPRSVSYLAEIVRRGGLPFAAGLSEPLPTPEQTELARDWLAAAAGTAQDDLFARWLDAVAAIVAARRASRPT